MLLTISPAHDSVVSYADVRETITPAVRYMYRQIHRHMPWTDCASEEQNTSLHTKAWSMLCNVG
jgi:hypothetical protein